MCWLLLFFGADAKAGEQAKRQAGLEKAKAEIKELEDIGSHVDCKLYAKAAKVHEDFVTAVQMRLDDLNIFYLVAPYQVNHFAFIVFAMRG